jgi:hypothetical protein
MREKSTFIRYVLSGAFTLAGLLLSVVTATAAGSLPPEPSKLASGGRATDVSRTNRAQANRAQAGKAQANRAQPNQAPAGPRATARTFSGEGFDTCQAPDLATMDAWRAHSSYGAVGIYFGGRARACATQAHLTADWVRQTTDAGWSLLPIYVGSQSPCVAASNKNPYRIDTKDPAGQGTAEGKDAVQTAQALGLDAGSALYFDMEAYDIKDAACTAATLKYVQAWNKQLRADGYLSGFYSSADSGITHLESARLAGVANLPDAVWFARWGVTADVVEEPALDSAAWTPHARIHQYRGTVTETYGGKKLSIDRDLIDAPVAVVG